MSTTFRTGLGILGLLSLADVAGLVLTDGEHPPMAIAAVGAVIGVISLALVAAAWRGVRRAVVPLVVLRVLSALSAVPAFFEPDVPGAAKAAAGIAIVLTVLGLSLTLAPSRTMASAR